MGYSEKRRRKDLKEKEKKRYLCSTASSMNKLQEMKWKCRRILMKEIPLIEKQWKKLNELESQNSLISLLKD